MAKKKVVFHNGCAQSGVGHTTYLILGCLLFSIFSLDQRMPVYKETGQSLSYMSLSFFPIKLWDHLRESWISCFFVILFLAFAFVKGMKGSCSGNPFSVAQYCPAGTPQKSLAQSTKDPRKGLHQSSLSGVPSTWERMQPIPWPQVPSSWSKHACRYLLSWVHYCDWAIIINSLRQH